MSSAVYGLNSWFTFDLPSLRTHSLPAQWDCCPGFGCSHFLNKVVLDDLARMFTSLQPVRSSCLYFLPRWEFCVSSTGLHRSKVMDFRIRNAPSQDLLKPDTHKWMFKIKRIWSERDPRTVRPDLTDRPENNQTQPKHAAYVNQPERTPTLVAAWCSN